MAYQNLNDAKHWRDRAAEMRALAGEMKEIDAQATMLKLASDYDVLAERAEERIARSEPRSRSPNREGRF